MNYEKTDWGYAGKLFGSCMTALGLAAGLALFSSRPQSSLETLANTPKPAQATKNVPRIPQTDEEIVAYVTDRYRTNNFKLMFVKVRPEKRYEPVLGWCLANCPDYKRPDSVGFPEERFEFFVLRDHVVQIKDYKLNKRIEIAEDNTILKSEPIALEYTNFHLRNKK